MEASVKDKKTEVRRENIITMPQLIEPACGQK
jgi:hypothetical protein